MNRVVEQIYGFIKKIKLKPRERFFLFFFILCVAFLFYYRPFYLPKAVELRSMRARFSDYRSERIKLQSQLPDIEAFKKKIESAKAGFEDLQKKLDAMEAEMPTEDDTASILSFISKNTEKLKIKLTSVKPDAMQVITTKGAFTQAEMAGDSKSKAKSQDKGFAIYKLFPIDINLSAPFEDIIAYSARLEKISQYMKITDYKMRIEAVSAGIPDATIRVQVLLAGPRQKRSAEERREVFSTLESMISTMSAPDPFRPDSKPLDKGEAINMYLEGVMWQKDKPHAIINGSAYTVGSVVDGKKIIDIKDDSVSLEENGKEFVLTLKQQ